MKSQTLKFFLVGALAFQFSACSFDKKEVRDEQQRRESQQKADRDAEADQIVGTYEGFLNIQGKAYEIIMTINNLGSQGASKDSGSGTSSSASTIAARIKRSDVILSEDAKLSGTYSQNSKFQLNNIKAIDKISEFETSRIEISVSGDRLIGSLSQLGGKLGTLDVTRTSRISNLDFLDTCDSFFKTVRPKVEEITGLYEFTRRPEGYAPMTQDLSIQAFRDLSLSAVTQADGFEAMTMSAFFVPYDGPGTLYLKTISAGKEILALTLERQDGPVVVFAGTYISSTGRQGRAELRKVSEAAKFCPAIPPDRPSKPRPTPSL